MINKTTLKYVSALLVIFMNNSDYLAQKDLHEEEVIEVFENKTAQEIFKKDYGIYNVSSSTKVIVNYQEIKFKNLEFDCRFNNLLDITSFFDNKKVDFFEGFYSKVAFSTDNFVIDSVSNYIIIERKIKNDDYFSIYITSYCLKDKLVLSKKEMIYSVGWGLINTESRTFINYDALEVYSENKFSISPSIADDKVVLKGDLSNVNVQIVDLKGNIIFNNKYLKKKSIEFDINRYSTGYYLIRVLNNRGELLETLKFMKK